MTEFFPTRRSLFITLLFLSFYLWIALTVLKPIGDFDFWWHLASGRYIVQHKIIPHMDVFSLTCRGRPWIDSYWLYEILLFGFYRLGGFNGILLANAALIVAILFAVDRRLRLFEIGWLGRITGLLVIFLGSQAWGDLWNVQASLITLLFVSLLLYSLEQWQRRGWHAGFWIWPPLFIFWANMHRGFTIGLVLAGLILMGSRGLLRDWKLRLGWLCACAAATLVNPYHFRLYRMIWDDAHLSPQKIMGWSAPVWPHWEIFWCTLVLLGFVLALQGIRKKLRLGDLLIAVFLGWTSVHFIVNVPFVMIFAIPYLWQTLSDALRPSKVLTSLKRYEIGMTAVSFIVLFWGLAQAHVRGGIDAKGIPVRAADMIADAHLPAVFYNDYRFGGYWMWRFSGTPPVFIDGRYPAVQGYDALLDEINQAKYHGPAKWAAFLNRYHVSGALMKYPESSPYPALFDLYFPRKQWALVDWDDIGLLFLRRTPANHAVIAAHEFRDLSPDADFGEFVRRLRTAKPLQKHQIYEELKHNLTVHPDSELTRFLISLYEKN